MPTIKTHQHHIPKICTTHNDTTNIRQIKKTRQVIINRHLYKRKQKMKEKTNLFSITSLHSNNSNSNKNNHKLSAKNRSYVTSQSTLNRSGNNYSSTSQLSVNNGYAQVHASSGNGKKGYNGEVSQRSVSRSFRKNGRSQRQNVSARLNAKSYLRDLMSHNVSSIHKEPSERENKDHNVVSRENSESKQKKYSDLSVRSRQETKSSRQVYLANKQNKSYRGQEKSTNISILYDDRPHQSQNLNQQLPYKCASQIHRKLYTFCNQVKPNQHFHYPYSNPSSTKPSLQLLSHPQSLAQQTQHKQKQQQNKSFNFIRKQNKQSFQHSSPNPNPNSNFNSHCFNSHFDSNSNFNPNTFSYSYHDQPATIVVKEDQLKRFTHKFAREKIQFQEVVSLLKQEIRDLREGYNRNELERQDILQCLQYKEQIQTQLRQQLKQLSIKYEKQCLEHQKLKLQTQTQTSYHPPNPQAPLLYLPHSYSIQSSQQNSAQNSNESKIISQSIQPYQNKEYEQDKMNINININQRIYDQLQYLRNQCLNKDNINKQNCSVIQYLRIQNQYVKRELQIQKDVVIGVREELRLMREKLGEGLGVECGDIVQEKEKEIQQLMNQNARLAHEKQTLQRSLQVSSQIIVQIKQENSKLRRKNSQKASIPLGELERIIRQMMSKQLQLQDKLKQKEQQLLEKEREIKNMKRIDKCKCQNINEEKQNMNYCKKQEDMKNYNSHDLVTDSNLMPISIEKPNKDNFTSSLSHNLQKLYEQGYQSVKRKGQAKHKHCKTQSEDSIGYQSINGRNYTDISYSEEQKNSPMTKNKKYKSKAQNSAKSSALY